MKKPDLRVDPLARFRPPKVETGEVKIGFEWLVEGLSVLVNGVPVTIITDDAFLNRDEVKIEAVPNLNILAG